MKHDEELCHNWFSYFIASISVIIAFSIMFMGCTLSMLDIPHIQAIQALTPEQIKAFNENNEQVWSCILIAGPPPGGRITLIILPKDSAGPSFGDGCSIQKP